MNNTQAKAWLLAVLLAVPLAGAQPTPAPEPKQNPEESFQTMDANGDDRVSRDEHATAAQRMFADMDLNRDGSVTPIEMDGRARQNGTLVDRESAEKVKQIDRNNDGQLTSVEHEIGSSEVFIKMDSDGNGFLSEEEFTAGHQTRGAERGTW